MIWIRIKVRLEIFFVIWSENFIGVNHHQIVIRNFLHSICLIYIFTFYIDLVICKIYLKQ